MLPIRSEWSDPLRAKAFQVGRIRIEHRKVQPRTEKVDDKTHPLAVAFPQTWRKMTKNDLPRISYRHRESLVRSLCGPKLDAHRRHGLLDVADIDKDNREWKKRRNW